MRRMRTFHLVSKRRIHILRVLLKFPKPPSRTKSNNQKVLFQRKELITLVQNQMFTFQFQVNQKKIKNTGTMHLGYFSVPKTTRRKKYMMNSIMMMICPWNASSPSSQTILKVHRQFWTKLIKIKWY
jgi:hypothetical protein